MAWTSSRIPGMNSSRTRFGRISIKALNCGEKIECERRAAMPSGECLIRWSEREPRRARREEKSERGSERKGLRVHSANGSRRPRSETAFPSHTWLVLAESRRLPGGRVRSLQLLRDSSLSLFLSGTRPVLRVCNWPERLADDISLYGGRHRRLINEL